MADTVVVYFSRNRPMQLDLALITNKQNCIGLKEVNQVVIYKADKFRFDIAYQNLAKEHTDVAFIQESDFKNDLKALVADKKNIMFVVDDCIFTSEYNILQGISILSSYKDAIGFSFRLGMNTKYCYPLGIINKMPNPKMFFDGTMRWNWCNTGFGDFNYPLELSSSIYRTEDIIGIINDVSYNSPNSLETCLSWYSNYIKSSKPFLYSYKKSVAFCNPINKVQEENNNRAGNKLEYSIDSLLVKYEQGYRINHVKFNGFISSGCHEEVDLEFVKVANSI